VSDYAKSKIMAEHGLAQISSTSFQVIAVRNATAFGWSNSFRSDIVVNAMTADAMLKGLIKVNDPSAHRPLAHCHNISGAMIHFARFGAKLDGSLSDFIPVNFAPFNYTIGEIALAVQKEVESAGYAVRIEYAQGGVDKRDYLVSNDRFQIIAGRYATYQSYVTVRKAVKEMLSMFKENQYQGGARFVRIETLKDALKRKPDRFKLEDTHGQEKIKVGV